MNLKKGDYLIQTKTELTDGLVYKILAKPKTVLGPEGKLCLKLLVEEEEI